jgi:hypothetical protein
MGYIAYFLKGFNQFFQNLTAADGFYGGQGDTSIFLRLDVNDSIGSSSPVYYYLLKSSRGSRSNLSLAGG